MASRDHPRMLDIEIELTPAAVHPGRRAGSERPGRRLKIWEIPANWLCSVIGTCLTPADIQQILKRSAIRLHDGAYDYEIHGYVVGQARDDGRVGREINKMLDHKYRAILRKVADEPDEVRLAALWDELCTRGLVAAAYWAFISHAHVPEWLKTHAFGEVHMPSHFMGGFNRQSAKELWLAEREVGQLADKLAGHRRRARDDLAERDCRIAGLEQELQHAQPARQQLPGARAARCALDHRLADPAGSRPAPAQRDAGAPPGHRAGEPASGGAGRRVGRPEAAEPPAADHDRRPRRGPDRAGWLGGRLHPLCRRPLSFAAASARPRRGARRRAPASRRWPRRDATGAGEPDRPGGRGVLPDRLHQPSRLPQGQASLPPLAKPFVPLRSSSATCFARAIEAWCSDHAVA